VNALGVGAERTEIDGVTTFWTEAPSPFTAVLMFRVGRADETLATNGITHPVEHLALFPLGQTTYQSNGFVEDGLTAFFANGTREQVFEFITRVAKALSSLPLERLETEKRVLLTEGASSSYSGAHARLMTLRFGARTYGLGTYQEFGLRSIPPAITQSFR
jgi:predicted Zn-dependent peptidase